MRIHYDKISFVVFSLLLITIPYYLNVNNPATKYQYWSKGNFTRLKSRIYKGNYEKI